jgi:hypothetical protein
MPNALPVLLMVSSVVIGSFQQSGGTVSLEFERPIAASADAANDNTLALPLDQPVTLIMARGPGNGFSDLSTDYHG